MCGGGGAEREKEKKRDEGGGRGGRDGVGGLVGAPQQIERERESGKSKGFSAFPTKIYTTLATCTHLVAVLVVDGLLLLVGEHVVGLSDVLELLRRLFSLVLVLVRVPLHGQLAVRPLDLGVGGATGHPQDLIVVRDLGQPRHGLSAHLHSRF